MRPPVAARAPLPLPLALLSAAVAGLLLDTAFPDRDWWPLAFPAVALALLALAGRRAGSAALVGLVFGGVFYVVHIQWAAVFLGPVPWAALATVMALWCAAGGVLIALATRWVPLAFPGLVGRLALLPAVVAGLWTAREAIASVWPYGGFAWGRVALSQSDSPMASLFGWLGVSGVSFVVVFAAAFALAAVREAVAGTADRVAASSAARRLPAIRLALATLLVVAIPLVAPAWPVPTEGSIRVGAVQGNGKTGYFDPPENRGDNLRDQYAATEPVYDEGVDVVVWPEGGSDLDPFRVPQAARVFDEVARRADAPLVSGIITARVPEGGDPETDSRYFNTAVVWQPGEGATDHYDKKHPVPFGEYVPDRAFWRQFAPDLIDLIGREYTPGTTDGVLDLGRIDGVGDVLAGVAICFDIVDDQLMTEMVEQGADLVLAPTNNADFGRTDESVQQLAIARVRAIELGRTVVNISTVGTSAIILPDGRILDRLEWYTADAMIADVPLATTMTPAVLLGRELEWLATAVGLGGLLVGAAAAMRMRREPRRRA